MEFWCSPYGRFKRWQFWVSQLSAMAIGLTFYLTIFLLIFGSKGLASLPKATMADLRAMKDVWDSYGLVLKIPSFVAYVVLFWVDFCATVKRYHDRDKSGWWFLLKFVPACNLWVLIECGFFSGRPDDNEYGPVSAWTLETEIEALKASRKQGWGPIPKTRTDEDRRKSFPPPPRPMFGNSSKN
jgi:uncharacterized membrane protein YhaH (DUF805 family)